LGVYHSLEKLIQKEAQEKGKTLKEGDVVVSTVTTTLKGSKLKIQQEHQVLADGRLALRQIFTIDERQKVKCVECGQEFRQSRTDQRYCSSRCKNRYNQRIWRQRYKNRK